MTLGQYLSSYFSVTQYLEFFLRILLAGIVGIIIGNERSRRFRGVGIYTHIIVCCAAALIMMVSKYGFADLTNASGVTFPGTRGSDSARIAAQAISGISFLCAGVIFKQGNNVKGLTTAAGIWLTLALGLTIGAGFYVLAGLELLVLLIMKLIFRGLKLGYDSYLSYQMNFTVSDDKAFDKLIDQQFKNWKVVKISSKDYTWNTDGTTRFDLTIHCKEEVTFNSFSDFLKANKNVILGASYSPHM